MSPRAPVAAALAALALLAGCSGGASGWRLLPAAPEARTEVAGAALGQRVAVVGGLSADGVTSARVDLYDPRRRIWIRLPDLPEPVHHAMAAARGGRLYVVGGFVRGPEGTTVSDRGWVLFDRRCRSLPRLPEPRAAGGAAIVRNRLYVVGGVRAVGGGALARVSMHLDLRTLRWTGFPGITPAREHLGVVAYAGRIYAIGGRTAGIDTNLAVAERYDPLARDWTRLPDPPTARGGGGAAVADRRIVAVGGERVGGTIGAVDVLDPREETWGTVPNTPRPRHGAAVVGIGRTVYQALGGPEPGLTASPALMGLRLPR